MRRRLIPTRVTEKAASTSQESRFNTIRDDIHTRYSELTDLVEERFPADSRGQEAFKYALELYLRAIPSLDVAVDGFTYLNVVEETNTEMRAVGISYVLPSSLLPIEVVFQYVDGIVEYRILVGVDDELWKRLSDSRRWKAVYLYATEGAPAEWDWDQVVEGRLEG